MSSTIEQALVHWTECQLATLEDMQRRKSTPKNELARQKSIVDGMVLDCKRYNVKPERAPRLSAIMGLEPE